MSKPCLHRLCKEQYKSGEKLPMLKPLVSRKVPQSIAVPFDQWPAWTKPIIGVRAKEDAGLGDTINREIHRFPGILIIAGKVLKTFARKLAGKSGCGCEADRLRLNQQYPFDGNDGRPARVV